MAVQDYLNLITSEHQGQPNFTASMTVPLSIATQIQNVLQSIDQLLDLDNTPSGKLLDVIGELVGASRNLKTPASTAFFAWDSPTVGLGWDLGIWQDPSNAYAIVTLPDDVYINLIRAKIARNNWDGTTEGAYTVWRKLFPQFVLLIQDTQNMSFILIIRGAPVDALTLALLQDDEIALRPEGVQISTIYTSVDSNPIFSWDTNNANFQGWDSASWAVQNIPT